MAYQTNQLSHFDICASFVVEASGSDLYEKRTAEHGGWELLAVPQGTASKAGMEIRGRRWLVGPDDVLIYNGLEPHTENYSEYARQQSTSQTARDEALVLSPGYLEKYMKEAGIDPQEIVFDSIKAATPRVGELFRTLLGFRKIAHNVSYLAYDCLVTDLVSELLLHQNHSHSGQIRKHMGSGRFPNHIDRAKRFIAMHASDPSLTVDRVARAAGLSKFHFIRCFKKLTGRSPLQYLRAIRVDLVKSSLSVDGSSITGAALDNGFASISTFNKAFLKQAGVSPRILRREMRRFQER